MKLFLRIDDAADHELTLASHQYQVHVSTTNAYTRYCTDIAILHIAISHFEAYAGNEFTV